MLLRDGASLPAWVSEESHFPPLWGEEVAFFLTWRVGAGAGPRLPHVRSIHELVAGRGASVTSFVFPSSVVSGASTVHRGEPRGGGKKGSWAPSSPSPGETELLLFLERSLCSQRVRVQFSLATRVHVAP